MVLTEEEFDLIYDLAKREQSEYSELMVDNHYRAPEVILYNRRNYEFVTELIKKLDQVYIYDEKYEILGLTEYESTIITEVLKDRK